jgi:hypothetical protein
MTAIKELVYKSDPIRLSGGEDEIEFSNMCCNGHTRKRRYAMSRAAQPVAEEQVSSANGSKGHTRLTDCDKILKRTLLLASQPKLLPRSKPNVPWTVQSPSSAPKSHSRSSYPPRGS